MTVSGPVGVFADAPLTVNVMLTIWLGDAFCEPGLAVRLDWVCDPCDELETAEDDCEEATLDDCALLLAADDDDWLLTLDDAALDALEDAEELEELRLLLTDELLEEDVDAVLLDELERSNSWR